MGIEGFEHRFLESLRAGFYFRVLEAGEVEYVEEPMATPQVGSVLICCSTPKTDVIVDV